MYNSIINELLQFFVFRYFIADNTNCEINKDDLKE